VKWIITRTWVYCDLTGQRLLEARLHAGLSTQDGGGVWDTLPCLATPVINVTIYAARTTDLAVVLCPPFKEVGRFEP